MRGDRQNPEYRDQQKRGEERHHYRDEEPNHRPNPWTLCLLQIVRTENRLIKRLYLLRMHSNVDLGWRSNRAHCASVSCVANPLTAKLRENQASPIPGH